MPETHRDVGEETARFQAFKDRADDLPPAWQVRARGGKVGVLVVVVAVAAVAALVVGWLLVG